MRLGMRHRPTHRLLGLMWRTCQGLRYQMVGRADDSQAPMGYRGVALNSQHGTALPSPVFPPVVGAPTPAAMRRVLRRARDGVALNVDEAAIALTARGDDLADLCASAG